MEQVPEFVTLFQNEAAKLEKKVGDPLFSRGTYQIEVKEGKEKFFPFIQMQDDGKVTDFFCSCQVSEKGKGCPHLAAAWLSIFKGHKEPLHVRFKKSFINQCFQIVAKRQGYQSDVLIKDKDGSYFSESKTKKKLFIINGKDKETIKEIIAPKKETEETSLKFSNWSFEETASYKEGKGSHQINYELSFWSDLAKWIFSLQEKGELTKVVFEGKPLPNSVEIFFKEVTIWFYIAEVNWQVLIPAMPTIDSPYTVFDEESLTGAIFDPVEKRLLLQQRQGSDKDENMGYPIGDWIFIEGKGFARKQKSPLFQKGVITEKEIGKTLTQGHLELSRFLPIFPDSRKPRYELYFDGEGNLHIEWFVFEKGDLKEAEIFFPWVYLKDKGFYLIGDWLFEGKEKIVPQAQVADFINRHRVWIHQFKGFEIHLGSLESHLVYKILENGDLQFDAELTFPEGYEGAKHFDDWVYIPGFGFYIKRESSGRLPLHPGLHIPKEDISSFIATHKEELEQVQGFFLGVNPITSSGLEIGLNEEGSIIVTPKWIYGEGIDIKGLKFFGDYVYLNEKGFAEIAPSSKLPERFHQEVKIPATSEASFLAYELEPLKPYILKIDPKLKKPSFLKLKVRRVSKTRKENEWLVDLMYESDLGTIEPIPLWEGFQEKKKHLFTTAGLLSLKDPRFQWLRQLPKKKIDHKKGVIRLNTLEWIRLTLFEQLEPPKGDDADSIATRKLLAQLEKLETDKLLDTTKLKATLRPYQEQGLAWLWFLYCHRLSGLLCDDMGLGKTHQAMALLAAVSSQNRQKGDKYLVVCPTSVIYHWEDLLKRFLPEIRVCTYYGLARSLESFDEEYDLLLTSYGILRTGRENLRSFTFEVAIFDEIQIAKNETSQTHQALCQLRAHFRLGLTGTPIENRIKELKSLFDIVLPTYMPTDAVFRELFVHPIEKHGDQEKKELLGKLVKPFILRRRKKEVLTDLPEKIEEIAYSDLSPIQLQMYREVVEQMRSGIYKDLKDTTKPISYLHVFSALTTLKQICDHPALYHEKPLKYEDYACGKWDLFVELMDEAMDSGQKVVVFSQYLDMLAIIEAHLKKKKIGFSSIKGSTRNRKEELLRFKEDPECRVFVASLLAAGVGIDLTIASIVIHYDRWWNPAKENQATDRVHRIGQNRGVQVFKLVTKGTIEEDIHAIIERKKGLLEDIVGAEDQITYLSREELLKVFEKMFANY